ncbi:transcription antitermination factor NusB [Veillonella agrestimuris]|uniref:transcription antitermination factor NusB n=1 Tax=Veillonella agrestimuris TaxID=2941340 RepID=UPI00203E567F|nr:transcription antitermination factor NusB [Veillonella agrestimuris]
MKRNRREARQYAFQTLYANEFHGVGDEVIFPEGELNLSMDQDYAKKIINGVLEHLQIIDESLAPYCKKRPLPRMDTVDRSILRIAVWELTYNREELSPSIVINEAVQLAKLFGSDTSYKLVNAILDGYYKNLP